MKAQWHEYMVNSGWIKQRTHFVSKRWHKQRMSKLNGKAKAAKARPRAKKTATPKQLMPPPQIEAQPFAVVPIAKSNATASLMPLFPKATPLPPTDLCLFPQPKSVFAKPRALVPQPKSKALPLMLLCPKAKTNAQPPPPRATSFTPRKSSKTKPGRREREQARRVRAELQAQTNCPMPIGTPLPQIQQQPIRATKPLPIGASLPTVDQLLAITDKKGEVFVSRAVIFLQHRANALGFVHLLR